MLVSYCFNVIAQKILWILNNLMVSELKFKRGFSCLILSSFMGLLLHMLWAGEPLLISGSLEGKYTCGNLRVVKKNTVLVHSHNLVSKLVHQASGPFLFLLLSYYFRLLFSVKNSFLPVFICIFHFYVGGCQQMIFPSNLKVAYCQSQIIFLVLVYLYMMICWTQSIFLMYFIFSSKVSNSNLEMCIVVTYHYNKTICLIKLLKTKFLFSKIFLFLTFENFP